MNEATHVMTDILTGLCSTMTLKSPPVTEKSRTPSFQSPALLKSTPLRGIHSPKTTTNLPEGSL